MEPFIQSASRFQLPGATSQVAALDEPVLAVMRALTRVPPDTLFALPAPETGYQRYVLYREEPLELIALCWSPGAETTLHSHGESLSCLQVLEGVILEERYVPDGDSYRFETHWIPAGQTQPLPVGGFHRLRSFEVSRTLHAFAPRLTAATEWPDARTATLLEQACLNAARAVGTEGPYFPVRMAGEAGQPQDGNSTLPR